MRHVLKAYIVRPGARGDDESTETKRPVERKQKRHKRRIGFDIKVIENYRVSVLFETCDCEFDALVRSRNSTIQSLAKGDAFAALRQVLGNSRQNVL
jgi:hypothetical protein